MHHKTKKEEISVDSLIKELEILEAAATKRKAPLSPKPLNWSEEKLENSLEKRDEGGLSILQRSIKDQKSDRIKALWDLRRMKKFVVSEPINGKVEGQVELMMNLLEDIKQCQIAYGKIAPIDGDESCLFKDVFDVLHLLVEISLKARSVCQERSFVFLIESLEEILKGIEYDQFHHTDKEDAIQLMLENAPFLYVEMFTKNTTLLMTLIGYCHETLSFAEKYINKYVSCLDQKKLEGQVLNPSELEEENDLYESLDTYTVEKFMGDLSIWHNKNKNVSDRLIWSDELLNRSLFAINDNKDTTLQACIIQEKEEIIDTIWQLRREKKIRVFEFDCSIPKNMSKMENYKELLDDIVNKQKDLMKIPRGHDFTNQNVADVLTIMAKLVLEWRTFRKDESLFFLFRGFEEIIERLTHNRNLDARKDGQTSERGPFCCDLIVRNKSLLMKLISFSEESLDRMKSYLKAVFFVNQVGFGDNVLTASRLWEPDFKEIRTHEGLSILEIAARGGHPRMFTWVMEACDITINDSKESTSISAAKILYQAVSAKVNPGSIIDKLFKTVPSPSWQGLLLRKLDDDDNMAIHCAVENNNLPAVLKLCEYGVSLVVLNKHKKTPKALIKPGSEDILKFFNEIEEIVEAAKNGQLEKVGELLQRPKEQEDAKLNARVLDGLTINKLLQRHLG